MVQVYDHTNSRTGKHLTYEERVKIEAYKNSRYSNRKIVRILGRAPQTINNAINRGTVRTINTVILLMQTIKYTFGIDKIVVALRNG